MSNPANPSEAQLILQLYDLRREPEMRKARNWWLNDFWPASVDDFLKIAYAMGTPENNWMRQVGGYWGIAASFVLQGALSEELFLRPGCSGEMFVLFGKVYPFLPELREKLGDPELLLDVEKVIMRSEWGRDRLQFILKRIAMWKERKAPKAAGASAQ